MNDRPEHQRWSLSVPFLEVVVECNCGYTFAAHPGSEVPGYNDPALGERCPPCGSKEIGIDSFDPRRAVHLAAWSDYYSGADPASRPWAAEFGIIPRR
jgi:hypothetical protein